MVIKPSTVLNLSIARRALVALAVLRTVWPILEYGRPSARSVLSAGPRKIKSRVKGTFDFSLQNRKGRGKEAIKDRS